MMNYTRPIIHRILNHQPLIHNNTQRIKHQLPLITTTTNNNYFSTTSITQIKPGTPIPGLENIYPKNTKDPSKDKTPVYLKREEYPSWVSQLMVPLIVIPKMDILLFLNILVFYLLRGLLCFLGRCFQGRVLVFLVLFG